MIFIWYILRCKEGEEKKAVELLEQQYVYPKQAEIFLITYERMKRYGGNWRCLEETLFQGYVFADTESREYLEKAACDTAVFQIYGNGKYCLRLDEPEQKFLRDVGGEEHHIQMSKGYIRDGVTFVTEGPLCGKEYRIRKIDRHKRMARIDSPLKCCERMGMWMGLEITAKS